MNLKVHKAINMNTKKISNLVFLLGIIATGLVSCKQESTTKTEVVQPVKIFKVNGNSNQLTEKVFTGLVKESREVKLAFQISGPLVKLNAEEGQFVKKGEVVAILDERDYLVQLQAANASYENAKLQAERYAALYEKKSTSKSIHDQMQAAYKLAKAQKDAAENALRDTKIYAPFSGYVQSLFVENYEKIAAGQPIVSILDLSNLEINVALSENDILHSKSFKTYTCKFENFKDKNFELSLIEIEKKPNRDNFYRMRLKINTEDYPIVPGMVASVTIGAHSDADKVQKVPVESIFHDNGKTYVWKFDTAQGIVNKKEVVLGNFNSNGMIDIEIKNGVSVDEMIIVSSGVHTLKENQKVKEITKRSNSNVGGQL